MTHDEAQAVLSGLSLDDPATVFRVGIGLLNADRPEELLETARSAALRHRDNPRLNQLLGLTARATGHSRLALDAFGRAARLAPVDPLITHSHARAALEAGEPATALFDRAARLSPQDASVVLGRIAAIAADQSVDAAIEVLAQVVGKNALWFEGHRTLARLKGQQGLDPAESVTQALSQHPDQIDLHRELIAIRLEARDLDGADNAASIAFDQFGDQVWLAELCAHIASERGAFDQADKLFKALGPGNSLDLVAQRARHLIRANRPERAIELIEPWIANDNDRLLWPYLALAWRMTGDHRWTWLAGDERLIGVYDLGDRVGDLDVLADHLRGLHNAKGAPLDQSVRGGTQTDGNLLLRDEAPITGLRSRILETVADYITQLPPSESGHPFLIATRSPIRIAGSWSVRLVDDGFHADHIHSQGWISSAFYVSLPGGQDSPQCQGSEDGWLSLGEERDLVPELAPLRLVEPKPGRLVLFPSIMWHGTRPFAAGERLTVAFDIARPQQG